MILRRYDKMKDQEACLRMFNEDGWMPLNTVDDGRNIELGVP